MIEIIRQKIRRIALMLSSSDVFNYINEFRKSDNFLEHEIKEYQFGKLQKLLDFSFNNVPYYRDLFKSLDLTPEDFKSIEDLNKLPILTKEIIWKEGSRMYATCELDNVKSASTSGSSGQITVLKKTKMAREIEQALMWRYKENGGINPNGCSIMIWGGHSLSYLGNLKNTIKHWLLNEYFYDTYKISDKQVEEIIHTLDTRKVVYLRGYTSTIYYVAQQLLERGINYKIPFVSVTAEKLLDSQRAVIEQAFGPNLYNQYGCGECGAIAYECVEHTGLHHNFEHSILEVLDDNELPSQTGRVILTNLDNYAMPLIRYENGDMVTLANNTCSCGRQSILIEKIEGRTYDIFYGENGQKVHAGFLDDVLLEVDLLNRYKIKQLQIIQKEPLLYVCKYIADTSVQEDDRIEIELKYKKRLGEHVQFILQKVDDIQSAQSGKRHFVVSLSQYKKDPQRYD